jgi:hypothetical protein
MTTRKRFSVCELAPQPRAYTTDSMRARSRDVRLSAEIGAFNPNMNGRAWQGYSVAQLDAMDDKTVVSAVKATIDGAKHYMRDRLAARGRDGDYAQTTSNSGTTMRPTNSGSLGTGWDEQEFNVGMGAEPSDVNDANRKFWDRANAAVTRDNRMRRGPVTAESMNAAATAFWAAQPTASRLGGEWGKG